MVINDEDGNLHISKSHTFKRLTGIDRKMSSWVWWQVSLISALGKLRQMELCEFEISWFYIMNSRPFNAPH